jgi:endonuclease/exonuclease/phosphatase family metal-dependent hydrolase
MSLRIATYNVHGGVGLDRRYDPARIARVIAELDVDVIALQEVQSRGDSNMLDILRRATNMYAVAATTFRTKFGEFGNGLLSRFPIVSRAPIDLSIQGREPRNAIDARLDCKGVPLRIIGTHLGLRSSERREQSARLISALKQNPSVTNVLLGDINDWTTASRGVQALHAHLGESVAYATFPSLFPVLPLDRMWVSSPSTLVRVHAHRSRTARVASDHLPLVADLELCPPEPPHTK